MTTKYIFQVGAYDNIQITEFPSGRLELELQPTIDGTTVELSQPADIRKLIIFLTDKILEKA